MYAAVSLELLRFYACRITLYDYQAVCREYAGSSDSARTLSNVSAIWKMKQVLIEELRIHREDLTVMFLSCSLSVLSSGC